MIPINYFRHHNLCSIIIKTFCGFVYFHFIFLISGYEIYRIHIILLGSEADYYLFATLWLSRISVIPCSVTEKSLLVKHWSHIQNILHFSCNIFVFLLHCQSSLSVLFILRWKCNLHFRVSLSAIYFCIKDTSVSYADAAWSLNIYRNLSSSLYRKMINSRRYRWKCDCSNIILHRKL